jgi:hypothetical protein
MTIIVTMLQRDCRSYASNASSKGNRESSSTPVSVINTCCSSFTPSP